MATTDRRRHATHGQHSPLRLRARRVSVHAAAIEELGGDPLAVRVTGHERTKKKEGKKGEPAYESV